MPLTNLDDFITKTKHLLGLEKSAEEERCQSLLSSKSVAELCASGVGLTKLHVVGVRTGLGGRRLVKFARRKDTDYPPPLSSHKFSTGDIAEISFSSKHHEKLVDGIVSKVTEMAITVTCDEWPISEADAANRTFFLVLGVNDVTYRRLQRCIESLEKFGDQEGRNLVELLFGQQVWPFVSDKGEDIQFLDPNLNEPQKDAVKFCVQSDRIFGVVHGPPGTGKTRTVVEIIRQFEAKGQKVLVCAPSNVAVDNLVERLGGTVNGLIRMGHPARSHPNVLPYTLDAVLSRSDHHEILQDIRKEMETVAKGGFRPGKGREIGALRKELAARESAALTKVLTSASVVCATLTSAGPSGPLKALKNRGFDVAVIDECAQSMEIACWIAMLQAKRAVVAGDHCQLPPTIISEQASKQGLSVTLMSRIERELPERSDEFLRLLTVQYRMNSRIMDWASKEMYSGQLKADDMVKDHLLRDLVSSSESDSTELREVIKLIDTDGCDMGEIVTADDESKGNPGEVKLVFLHARNLVDAGISEEQIAIISPYNLQVQLMRKYIHQIYPKIAIRSVDGFQGQEREAVILSLVRSNKHGEVGFLNDHRRINVAVTRARRQVCIVGDSHTVSKDSFLASLIQYIGKEGTIVSGLEFKHQLEALPFEVDTSDLFEAEPVKKSQAPSTEKKNETKSKTTANKPKSTKPREHQSDMIKSAKEPRKLTLEEDESWKDDILEQILRFHNSSVDGSRNELSFPPSLDAYQRRFVHEKAEELGLEHVSQGEGSDRHIVIRKIAKPETATDVQETSHTVAAGTSAQVSSTTIQSSTEKTKTKNKNKGKKTKAKGTSEPDLPDDNDELLDRSAYQATRCQFPKCKTAIDMLGQRCPYCIQTFCLSHCQAELHGCGEAAKVAAKREYAKRAEGLAPSKVKPENRAFMERKLEKRLQDMTQQRKSKASAAKKK